MQALKKVKLKYSTGKQVFELYHHWFVAGKSGLCCV